MIQIQVTKKLSKMTSLVAAHKAFFNFIFPAAQQPKVHSKCTGRIPPSLNTNEKPHNKQSAKSQTVAAVVTTFKT
jgi:hypothetical protein